MYTYIDEMCDKLSFVSVPPPHEKGGKIIKNC